MATKYKKLVALASTLAMLSLFGSNVLASSLADKTAPSTVENLMATPGDGEVTLQWDPATDNIGVDGYYLYIGVSEANGNANAYEFGSIAVTDGSTTYTVNNLTNNLTYYFNVTAYDEAGNESTLGTEVDATPVESETNDLTAPTVRGAEALTSTLVVIEFSEPVNLPDDGASAFNIESSTGTSLNILDAYVSSDDKSNVMLVTSEQNAGTQYIVTAGISIEDLSGNTVNSGTSDTAIFSGSSLDSIEVPETDKDSDSSSSSTDFSIDEVNALSLNEIEVIFTQEVALAEVEDFIIQLEEDASVMLEVLSVLIDEEDETRVTLITEEMEAGNTYIMSIEGDLLNKDGESIDLENNEVEFVAPTLDIADLIAPEDITNLLSTIINETSVMLAWTHSLNSEGDLVKYLVYQSSDGGLSFGKAMTYLLADLDNQSPEITIDSLTPGATYTFRVSAMDANGNESTGVMTTVTLPESGAGILAMGAFSLLGAGIMSRRRKF